MSVPVIVAPGRFRTARQLWSYSGLGIAMRSSSDDVQSEGGWKWASVLKTRGLNWRFNRTLKYVFKGAATTVITKLADCPLRDGYRRTLDAGTKPNLAKLTLARKIAATLLAMWKHEEENDPTRHRKQQLALVRVEHSPTGARVRPVIGYLPSGEHGSRVSIHALPGPRQRA